MQYPVPLAWLQRGQNLLAVAVRKLNPATAVTPRLVSLEFDVTYLPEPDQCLQREDLRNSQ
ncbi:MAG: hypothetical protein CL878_01060 [Dehalococcoidia bacterium]|nr:hypothetical protein [Dehalococcoidia bacterium]